MKIFWLAALALLVMPLFAWAGDCGKHGDGCGCAKAHHECKCQRACNEGCTKIPVPEQACPMIDPACAPHSDYRLLCGPCHSDYTLCCMHEEYRLLCCETARPKCGPKCKPMCKPKCQSMSSGLKTGGGIEF